MDFNNSSSSSYIETPLSIGQKSLWLTQQLTPNTGTYNVHLVLKIPTDTNLCSLRKSLTLLYYRHPILRTTYHEENGEPVQRTWNQVSLDFREEHTHLEDDEFFKAIRKELGKPFFLDKSTTKWIAYHRHNGELYLVFFIHHITGDFWSYIFFLADLRKIYNHLENGIYEPVAPLEKTYQQKEKMN